MILGDLLRVKPALDRLTQKQFSNFQLVRQLAFLTKAVNEEVEFYNKQEVQLIQEYAAVDEKGQLIFTGPNTIQMKNPEDRNKFEEKISKLKNVDVSDKITKVKISEGDFKTPEDFITPADLVILLPVIDFE